MTDKVIRLDTITTLDLQPELIIKGAMEEKFKDVVIMGLLEDGEAYYATNIANVGNVLLILERFKLAILEEE
jgi:hypothetical protein